MFGFYILVSIRNSIQPTKFPVRSLQLHPEKGCILGSEYIAFKVDAESPHYRKLNQYRV